MTEERGRKEGMGNSDWGNCATAPRGIDATDCVQFFLYNCTYYLTDTSLLEATSRTVRQVFRCEGFSEFQSRWAFIATWHNVSVYYTITARYRVGVVYPIVC